MSGFDANDPLIGRRLGVVELVSPLGAGGMGRVYRGWHHGLGLPVAVKVVETQAQRELVKRLNVEVQAAKKLQHPNMVRVLDSGEDREHRLVYVVMEFVEGKDLAHVIAGGRKLDIKRSCAVMIEVLAALSAAHALKILHRDIKPANIMLTRQRDDAGQFIDRIKVVDFGLAKLPIEDLTPLTRSGFALGTPGFMSPEQALGEVLDARADVYACGVTLYRILAGAMPFRTQQLAAMFEPPPPIARIAEELQSIVRWAMAAKRDARCPTAEKLSAALRPFAEGAVLSDLEQEVVEAPLHFDLGASPEEKREPTKRIRPPLPGADSEPPIELDRERAKRFEVATPQQDVLPVAPTEAWSAPPRPIGRWVAAGFTAGAVIATALVLLALGPGAAPSLRDELNGLIARGAPGVAETRVLEQPLRSIGAEPLDGVVNRLLSLRRVAGGDEARFDPEYQLRPSTWAGETLEPRLGSKQTFTLSIEQVVPGGFSGQMQWGSGAVVAVTGLWQGNQLVFTDQSLISGSAPGYVFHEKKAVFIDGENRMIGVDGPFRLPLTAKNLSGGPAPSPREPTPGPMPALSNQALADYIGWKRKLIDLDNEALERISQLSQGVDAREKAQGLQEELKERRRRLLVDHPPLPLPVLAAVEEIVGAMFQLVQREGVIVPLGVADRKALAALRARHGGLIDRVMANEAQMFEAWVR